MSIPGQKQETAKKNQTIIIEDVNDQINLNQNLNTLDQINPQPANQMAINQTDTVMRHITTNLGRYSHGKVYTKAQKKARYKENERKGRAFAQMSNLHSDKDRKNFLNESDKLYEEAAKKTKKLNEAKNQNDEALVKKLKMEILTLQCEARKCQIKAKSIDKVDEEFQIQMQDYWLLNRMEDLASENPEESYNNQHALIESKKLELHKKMRGNKSFVEYRKRVLNKIKAKNPQVTLVELERLTKEQLGEEGSSVFMQEDYLTVMENENEESRAIDNIINKLKVSKDALGGSPNFPDSDPTLPEELVMTGEHGLENRRAFARKMLRGNMFQKMYGKVLEWKYGQASPPSQYEIAFQYLLSLKKLAIYKDVIQGEYAKDKAKQMEEVNRLPNGGIGMESTRQMIYGKYTAGHDMLFALTRMSCHNNLNGASIESDHCDEILTSIVKLIEKLENSGDPDALVGFFRQLDGSCFDDRLRNVQEYAERKNINLYDEIVVSNYEVDTGGSDDIPEPADHSLYIRKKSEINAMKLNAEMDILTAMNKVIDATVLSNGMNPDEYTPAWKDVKPEIMRQLVGKTFYKITETGAKDTESKKLEESDINNMEDFMRDIMGVVS